MEQHTSHKWLQCYNDRHYSKGRSLFILPLAQNLHCLVHSIGLGKSFYIIVFSIGLQCDFSKSTTMYYSCLMFHHIKSWVFLLENSLLIKFIRNYIWDLCGIFPTALSTSHDTRIDKHNFSFLSTAVANCVFDKQNDYMVSWWLWILFILLLVL